MGKQICTNVVSVAKHWKIKEAWKVSISSRLHSEQKLGTIFGGNKSALMFLWLNICFVDHHWTGGKCSIHKMGKVKMSFFKFAFIVYKAKMQLLGIRKQTRLRWDVYVDLFLHLLYILHSYIDIVYVY